MFSHVISLGFFCSVASELDSIGLRDGSYPFDWVLSDFKSACTLKNNSFNDFLNVDNLYQYTDNRNYYDKKYNISFFHDFNQYSSLDNQINSAIDKYKRRIDRFYKSVQQPTLFLRYIRNEAEVDFINSNFEYILLTLKQYNELNEIIFISNTQFKGKIKFGVVFYVDPDSNDSVSRRFLSNNNELYSFLNSIDLTTR